MHNWFMILVLLTPAGEQQTVTAGPFTTEEACQITAATAEFEPYAPLAKMVSDCIEVKNSVGS